LRDELAAISQADLLCRFGLSEVARVALPNGGDWSLAISKRILASLDEALLTARDQGAEEIVLALSWNDTRSIELSLHRGQQSSRYVSLARGPDKRDSHGGGDQRPAGQSRPHAG